MRLRLLHALQLLVDLLRSLRAAGRSRTVSGQCGSRLRGCGIGGFRLRSRWVFAWLIGWSRRNRLWHCGAVVRRGVGIGRGRAAGSLGKDQLSVPGRGGFTHYHVAAGSVEQGGEDVAGSAGAVRTVDLLVSDAASDGDGGEFADVAEYLIEAGSIGEDLELAVCEVNLRGV